MKKSFIKLIVLSMIFITILSSWVIYSVNSTDLSIQSLSTNVVFTSAYIASSIEEEQFFNTNSDSDVLTFDTQDQLEFTFYFQNPPTRGRIAIYYGLDTTPEETISMTGSQQVYLLFHNAPSGSEAIYIRYEP